MTTGVEWQWVLVTRECVFIEDDLDKQLCTSIFGCLPISVVSRFRTAWTLTAEKIPLTQNVFLALHNNVALISTYTQFAYISALHVAGTAILGHMSPLHTGEQKKDTRSTPSSHWRNPRES